MSTAPSESPPIRAGKHRVGDVELAWELAGPASDKLPIVLIMGFSLPGRGWRFVRPGLTRDRLVLTFDNRGAGESDKPQGPYSMETLARDVLGLADSHGFGRFHAVGVSMGGMIAQHLALLAKERLASLTLIATHAGGFFARLPRPLGLTSFVTANLSRTPARRYRHIARMLFPAPFREAMGEEKLTALLRHDFEPPIPKHARRAQLSAVFGHDTRARLGALAGLPTLIMKPERDVLIHPRGSETLAEKIPGARLVAMPEAGHGLIRQNGDEVARLIREHADRAEAG